MFVADHPDSEGGTQLEVVHCWACSVLVRVPHVQGLPAPVYKCGWCGAITDTKDLPLHAVGSSGSTRQFPPGQHGHPSRKLYTRVVHASQAFIVGLVVALILSLIGVGVACVLPQYCRRSTLHWLLHMAFTSLLTFNILFNYLASICIKPGSPADYAPMPESTPKPVSQDIFADYTYCTPCRASKPPSTHHCSICATCIVDMDHHCPFIWNCVGRANLRNFLLLLAYISAATTYAFVLSCAVLLADWAVVSGTLAEVREQSLGWLDYLTSAVVLLVTQAPAWYLGSIYVAWMSFTLFVGVGSLLVSQLRYVLAGVSYVSSLKGRGAGGRPKARLAQLQAVFGRGHWSTWLLPRWGAASTAGSSDKQS